jgi:hypothetical protein
VLELKEGVNKMTEITECKLCKSLVKFYRFKELNNSGVYICQNGECNKEYYVSWNSDEIRTSIKEAISRLSTKDVSHEMRTIKCR